MRFVGRTQVCVVKMDFFFFLKKRYLQQYGLLEEPKYIVWEWMVFKGSANLNIGLGG